MKLLNNVATSSSGFVFNPMTGEAFSSNPVGIEIMEALKAGHSEKEIIEKITSRYEVDTLIFEKDLSDFYRMLKSYNLSNDGE
ncbi:MAG: PqqD family protein [Bacteroidales bacterium]|jgi:hypothetical protein|nr:PqqD family protein [Bacteroidales bacterium]